MDFLSILITTAALGVVVVIFTRYEPKLDLVKSGDKYSLFLWYNKYDWLGDFEKRKYIKLF